RATVRQRAHRPGHAAATPRPRHCLRNPVGDVGGATGGVDRRRQPPAALDRPACRSTRHRAGRRGRRRRVIAVQRTARLGLSRVGQPRRRGTGAGDVHTVVRIRRRGIRTGHVPATRRGGSTVTDPSPGAPLVDDLRADHRRRRSRVDHQPACSRPRRVTAGDPVRRVGVPAGDQRRPADFAPSRPVVTGAETAKGLAMTDRAFRFGVMAPARDGQGHTAFARRAEELGYSTLLTPDGPQLAEPFPALAMAAAATSTLRVGTFVLASPLRTPGQAAWSGHSLSVLSGGRFEFGIGTGLPAVRSSAEQLGMTYGSGPQRLARAEESMDRSRELAGDDPRTPVVVAAGGPRTRALAARKADTVTLDTGPLAPRSEVADKARQVREQAPDVEIAANLFEIGRAHV